MGTSLEKYRADESELQFESEGLRNKRADGVSSNSILSPRVGETIPAW